jgi:glucose/mannose-6-phosphate isomerase
MSMKDSLMNLPSQFDYRPEVINSERLLDHTSFVVCGMGGSHLAADLYAMKNPALALKVHKNYDIPELSEELKQKTLFIASSYSGNTEEVVSFLEKALKEKLNVAVIATGGKLIEIAKESNLPYIEMPSTGIQPRVALGYSLLALAKILGDEKTVLELNTLAKEITQGSIENIQAKAKELSQNLENKVPIIYSSENFAALAYIWKIKFNETAKIPAFYNTFPELNHNEMAGFDTKPETQDLSKNFSFIFLNHESDSEKIKTRMQVTKDLYAKRNFSINSFSISGNNGTEFWKNIFENLLLADFTALALSDFYNTEPEKVEIIEEFKKLI